MSVTASSKSSVQMNCPLKHLSCTCTGDRLLGVCLSGECTIVAMVGCSLIRVAMKGSMPIRMRVGLRELLT
jgi:hypothetical protein